jgi:hypothetical protein
MAKCWECKTADIPEPEYCCSGYECGCCGKPIDPPFCDECFKKIFVPSEKGGTQMIPAIALRNKTNSDRYLAANSDVGDWDDENLDVTLDNIQNGYLIIRKDLIAPTMADFEERKEWHQKLKDVLTNMFGPDPFVSLDFEAVCEHYDPVNIEITPEQFEYAKQFMEDEEA